MADFTLHIDQNKYLPSDGREVHAVLTVQSSGAVEAAGPPAEAAEIIIVDVSGSMTGGKIREARQAAAAAVQALRDGVHFAVIAGSERAAVVYPRGDRLVPASAATRSEAQKAVSRLSAGGGTEIGKWLELAAKLFAGAHPQAIKHAILMTDGQNNQSPEVFARALKSCEGRFVCDSLGVGDDWVPAELRKVAEALLGTFDFVRNQGDLAAFFRDLTQTSMSKTVAELALRVWVPQTATLKFVKQVSPTLLDLTGKRADYNPLTGDYPTGSWGAEEREYHLCVELQQPGQVGQEIRAGWVKLVRPETMEVFASGNVLAQWTDDLAASTQLNKKVAHYTGQAELHELIQEGLSARTAGDVDTATARLAQARQIAVDSGRGDTARLLDKVVEVDASGTARLRRHVDKADEIELDTGSVRTSKLRKSEEG
ncbi:VWA domain-containing protein [Nonomuraea sp. NBC_01738]|uniref:VWA domain-containing protein n=1 Tax=Nonomuraea sp. NBC_01738 TaxID=2976003 RepID=UPI002E136295|nr:VWA domain-containing protein [Nonomuraea sp. NBC_01738]